MKLTKSQRKALTNARDFGNAWYHSVGQSNPWRANVDLMHRNLVVAGLLTRDDTITEAGRAALA